MDGVRRCDGYLVCCVTYGTCLGFGGTISSNSAYYEGGCQSPDSSRQSWENSDCTEQGECHQPYLEQVTGSG